MTYQFSINIQDFEDLPDPQTKAELLQRMALTYQAAESLIAALDQSALIKPLIESGWSIKDHLAHLTTWEYGMVALFQKIDRFQAMGVDSATANNDDMNTINDAIYNLHKDRPFAEVLANFRQTHQELLSTLAPLTDQDLQKPFHYYQPQTQGAFVTNPVMGWLSGNTYGHYAEHLLEIGRFL